MLVKLGVDTSKLNREIRQSLNMVEKQYNLYNWEAVITCACEGTHDPGSLHYADDAYHVKKPPHSETLVLESIRRDLGKDFNVIVELEDYHIEYDPKRKHPIPKGTV